MEDNIQSNNQKGSTKMLVGVLLVIVLAGLAYFLFMKKDGSSATNNESVSSTTDVSTGTVGTVANNNGYTIEEVPIENKNPTPDLNRKVVVYAGATVTPEAKAYAEQKVVATQAKLKLDTRNWSEWINLGIYQKQAGDYDGALISWKYASTLAPSDGISLGNIANLYAYFIKNTPQAESYYKQAIAKSPVEVNLYVQLGEVYRDIVKDSTKARAIIDEGLKKIPNDQTLLAFKTTL